MKTIVLTGMMGSGKSTVGKLLAEKLNCRFVDLDFLIEKNQAQTISEIFKSKGETYFRCLEKETLFEIFNPKDLVISLGGGTFLDDEVREFLLDNSSVIYLKTGPETIYERIKSDTSRPLLLGANSVPQKIKSILENRCQYYETAQFIITTDNKNSEDICCEILGVIKDDKS